MSNELVQQVTRRVQDMQENEGLLLPPGYSASNALNTAWLILSDDSKGPSLLSKCDPGSISKSLLNMVIQGLSPAKSQCYFIPYGKQCTLIRSYFGSMSVVKRLSNVKDIYAEVVFQDDGFDIGSEHGRLVITRYEPHFENRDKPIIGAFAVVEEEDGNKVYTVMTKKEIDQSWSHAKTTKVQKEFPQEMAQRTVISRAAKYYINSSDDNDLFVNAVNETTENEFDDKVVKDVTPQPKAVEHIFNQPKSQAVVPNTSSKNDSAMPTAAEAAKALADDHTTKSVTEELGLSGSEGANTDVETSNRTKTSLADKAAAEADFFQAESAKQE